MSRFRVIMLGVLAAFAVSAVASASASAAACAVEAKCTWKIQRTEGGLYEEIGATRAHVETTGVVTSEFKLKATGGIEVKCKKISAHGDIETLGKGEADALIFTECSTNSVTAGCKIKSVGSAPPGEIAALTVPTQLVEREPKLGGVKKIADEFKGAKAEETFVELEVGATQKGFKLETACTSFPLLTKVKGQIAGEVTNVAEVAGVTPAETEATFPESELKGNTLKAFGVAAFIVGKAKQRVTPGEGFGHKVE